MLKRNDQEQNKIFSFINSNDLLVSASEASKITNEHLRLDESLLILVDIEEFLKEFEEVSLSQKLPPRWFRKAKDNFVTYLNNQIYKQAMQGADHLLVCNIDMLKNTYLYNQSTSSCISYYKIFCRLLKQIEKIRIDNDAEKIYLVRKVNEHKLIPDEFVTISNYTEVQIRLRYKLYAMTNLIFEKKLKRLAEGAGYSVYCLPERNPCTLVLSWFSKK